MGNKQERHQQELDTAFEQCKNAVQFGHPIHTYPSGGDEAQKFHNLCVELQQAGKLSLISSQHNLCVFIVNA